MRGIDPCHCYRKKGTGSIFFKSGKWHAMAPKLAGRPEIRLGTFEMRKYAERALENYRKDTP